MGKASTLFLAVSIMIIMVGMGLGLAVQDFNRVADNPTGSYWAVQLNYFVTPCWFWTLSYFQARTIYCHRTDDDGCLSWWNQFQHYSTFSQSRFVTFCFFNSNQQFDNHFHNPVDH